MQDQTAAGLLHADRPATCTVVGTLQYHTASHPGIASTQGLHSRFPPLIRLLLLGLALLNALNLLAGLGFRIKGLTPLHLDIVSVQKIGTVSVQVKKHSHQHMLVQVLCAMGLNRTCCCLQLVLPCCPQQVQCPALMTCCTHCKPRARPPPHQSAIALCLPSSPTSPRPNACLSFSICSCLRCAVAWVSLLSLHMQQQWS